MDGPCGIPAATRDLLKRELNRTGVDDGWAVLVYYGPDLLQNVRDLDLAANGDGREGVARALGRLVCSARRHRCRVRR